VVRGSAGVALGRLTGTLAVVKTPSARSDNLIYLYGEVPRTLDLAVRVTALTTGVVGSLTVDPARMEAALELGFTAAADLAELLMSRFGADYRTAHRVVQRAVRSGSLSADAVAAAAASVVGTEWRLPDNELAAMTDARALVASRTTLGGAAPEAMAPMLDRVRAAAAALQSDVDDRRAAVHAAETALRARATALAGR
jgi:argininosuccinate lyase